MTLYKGVYTAIITPFTSDNKIDWGAYSNLIERQISANVDGIVFIGTTGESPTLSHREHEEILTKSVKLVNKRTKVIHSIGSNNTNECLEFLNISQKAGADVVMAVNPYYNKPNQEGLYKHFKTIADNSEIPLMLYNIKGRTSVNIETETLLKLFEHPKIKLVKEASGDLSQQTDVIYGVPNDITVLSGDDPNTLAFIALGGHGVVSVTSNIIPKTMKKYIDYCLEDNLVEARKLFAKIYPLMKKIMGLDTNPLPIKELVSMLGYCKPIYRLPLTRMSDKKIEIVKKYIPLVKELEEYND